MPLSRPSLAFAGSAALVVVAGIVSHQVLMKPQSPTLPMPGLAGGVATPTIAEQVAAAPQAASAEPPVAVAKRAAPGPSQPPPAPPTVSAAVPDRAAAPRAEAYDADRLWAEQATRERSTEAYSEYLHTYPGSLAANVAKSRGTIAHDGPPSRFHSQGRDRFTDFTPNPVKVVAEEPVSTFSIDVDTASYAFLRAALNDGWLPDTDAVRTEELVNYFPYDYAPPESRDAPFATHVSVMPAPWNDAARLMHIGIKGYVLDRAAAPRANLVFLVDTSGSMDEPNKLPLLVRSLKLLLGALAPEDRVAIVAYAGSAGVVLEPTPVSDRGVILASLERLDAGGSTAGAEGIREAYRLAGEHFVAGGVNRVILATDGDFNVGISDPDALEDYIARKRESGVSLSVLGFGMGNYNDALMQRLAQHGNGNAAYIDSLS
ncbi:MAG: von Willebrand factor type A domain-containing protein, partial [Thiotrichales bacterium]|nr:von Willebrand factor type A domain-containing protein [Thiotrichales bacterium]